MSKEIALTKGKIAIVDDGDYDWLSQWKWHITKCGYAARKNKNKRLLMHRIIMNTPNNMFTDHINGNRSDNRRSNLRICTHQQNIQNQRKTQARKTSSQYKGVCWMEKIKKWRAKVNGVYLGVFHSEQEAARAYNQTASLWFGEFAKLNIL